MNKTLLIPLILLMFPALSFCIEPEYSNNSFLDFFFPYIELSENEEIKYADELALQFDKLQSLTDFQSERVSKIGNSILRFTARINKTYKFKIINSDKVNAFSLSNGYIWITTGLLNFIKSDDELAFALAHEISHEELQHNKKHLTMFYIKNYLGSTSSQLMIIAQGMALMPFEKTQEFEADINAVLLMKAAGYNEKAALTVLEKLSTIDTENNDDMGYQYRTHPYPAERKTNIEKSTQNQ